MVNLKTLDRFRITDAEIVHYGSMGDANGGAFLIPAPRPAIDYFAVDYLAVIASVGEGWDHVSVSLKDRCPTWQEMEHVKRLFFKPNETAMQLHVAVAEHIDLHPHCLHLWRPRFRKIPLPPSILV